MVLWPHISMLSSDDNIYKIEDGWLEEAEKQKACWINEPTGDIGSSFTQEMKSISHGG